MSYASQILGGGVRAWISGRNYRIGDPVISPITGQEYTRKTTGAGTTDPSLDTTNWKRLFGFGATKELGCAFNVAGFGEYASITQAGRGGAVISYTSPLVLAADTFATMFSYSGAISVSHLDIIRTTSTSMTWGCRITVDGEVIFDRSSAVGSTSGLGLAFAGKEYEGGSIDLPPIVATNSLLIEWKHSVGASGISFLNSHIIYQELQ